ncbi:heavy metal translocating P-type ATPase [Salirhabdus salicampi]|nr:heavy metal translocating P-type ATPase [Salirhabdus salicampi]MCP8617911.1 heavy metal translocating P-type ATPase [Salirhabdus salicampi]
MNKEHEACVNKPKRFSQLCKHAQLIAALFSGFLIFMTWLLEEYLSQPWTVTLYVTAYIIGGFAKAKEGIEETVVHKELNVELLMIIAAIGAASIGYWTEGAILIFIFALSGALETYTMNKSEKEISSLMNLQPETALRLRDGKEQLIPVTDLKVGDHFLVKAGERVPADGTIFRGETALEEAAITGESIPNKKTTGDDVFAGTMNLNGSITVQVTKPASESVFQKIIHLVQSAKSEKSPSQLFIEQFEGAYVKVVLFAGSVLLFLPYYAFGWTWQETFYRAMIFLVVASPCALVASIMPATLSAISNGARKGILFKGGVHVEGLAQVKAVALDKTGTITNGTPEVTDVLFAENSSFSKGKLLQVIGSIEKESNHPLANAIVSYINNKNIEQNEQIDSLQDIPGKGLKAKVNGETWWIGNESLIGTETICHFYNGIHEQLAKQGKTLVFVANDDGVVALFALKDTIRKDIVDAIKGLQKENIEVVMLTGDHEETAKAIAEEAGVRQYYANCLPEDKVAKIKELKQKHGHVAMIGDGINDAPALATANLGIAMGDGTDVALETADVVLIKNDLTKVSYALQLSQKMNRIVKQNVVFSITVIILLLLSNFLQLIHLPLGVIGHEGSTILVILNGLRLLK